MTAKEAILLSLLRRCNFVLSSSLLGTFSFAFYVCIQQVSVDYKAFDAGTVLINVSIYLRCRWYAYARPLCLLCLFINILLCYVTYMFTRAGDIPYARRRGPPRSLRIFNITSQTLQFFEINSEKFVFCRKCHFKQLKFQINNRELHKHKKANANVGIRACNVAKAIERQKYSSFALTFALSLSQLCVSLSKIRTLASSA